MVWVNLLPPADDQLHRAGDPDPEVGRERVKPRLAQGLLGWPRTFALVKLPKLIAERSADQPVKSIGNDIELFVTFCSPGTGSTSAVTR